MTTDDPRTHGPAAGEVPNEREAAARFPHGTGGPLREQVPLLDEHGTDVRTYTGEPVETDEGWVLPQQSVTGAPRVVGGGEFPDGEGSHGGSTGEAEDDPPADGGR